jgi:hypothetical protein
MRKSKRAVVHAGRSLARVALPALLLSGVAACKQSTSPIVPSIFTNPNEVVLVCFDRRDDIKDYAHDHPDWDPTLPLDCCDGVIGEDDAAIAAKLIHCRGSAETYSTPIAHALVTQVQRGEVAAVDLEGKKVLDSDSKIPGYTFIDVGGLPTALAIPPQVGTENGAQGPLWTYVAGRQTNSLRAVATCRFKLGHACGPETAVNEDGEKVFADAAAFAEATERALAGEPRDMVVSADGKGLWISLPDAGLLAYAGLPTRSTDVYEPFPEEIVYYPLPGGYDVQPGVPEPETDAYRFACAAGVTPDKGDEQAPPADDPTPFEAEKLQMPLSVPAESTRTPRPTLLRMVDVSAVEAGASEDTQLLFVADEGQMALHVYAQDAVGSLLLSATLPVGAPLRDFAVTHAVPVLGPTCDTLMSGAYYGQEGATKRYLYAIDERDGSLMAFVLSFDKGIPKLAPLLPPEPARDSTHRTLNLADRLSLGGDGFVARALDVVDTRARKRSDGSYDDESCHFELDPGRDKELSELQKDADKAQDAYSAADDKYESAKDRYNKTGSPEDAKALAETAVDARRAEADYRLATEDLAVLTDAGGYALRGVFLAVATTKGQFLMLDIHDLDLECRTKQQCAIVPDVELGVAVQRHTVRISGTALPTVTVSPSTEIGLPEGTGHGNCPTGYAQDEDRHICVSTDPWVARSIDFAVNYEGPFTAGLQNGVFEPDSKRRVVLKAPDGVDLCARGANADDGLLVGILSLPDDKDMSPGCSVETFTEVPRLRVLEAHRDHLLLEQLPDDIEIDTLLACYRGFVTFDMRLDSQYFVSTGAPVGYQHTNMSAADGTCVHDESLDPRFTSRAVLDEPFINQFVAFTLHSAESESPTDAGETDAGPEVDTGVDAGTEDDGGVDEEAGPEDDGGVDEEAGPEGDGGVDEDAGFDGGKDAGDATVETIDDAEIEARKEVNPTVSVVTSAATVVRSIAGSSSRTDVLPHRVRYFPFGTAGFLFVVDQASQGLGRFFLTPTFQADTNSNFR